MSIRRTLTEGVALATLLLLIAAPAGAATSDSTARGTATTTSVPLHVEALGQTAELGRTVLMATTDSDRTTLAPWSTVQLTLAALGEERFGELNVSSDGTTMSESADVNESNDVGTVSATAGNVLALADGAAGTARAELETLTADATVLLNALAPEDVLQLEATVNDAVATVDDAGAEATHSLVFSGIDLGLAHVLGGVLAELPLEDLITIAGALDIDVPSNLDAPGDVVTATEELLATVATAAGEAIEVDTAAQALFDADDGALATLTGYAETIDALLALDVSDLDTDDVDVVNAILDDPRVSDVCELDSTLLATLALDLATVEDCVDDAIQAHLGTLGTEFDLLDGAVQDYLDAVQDAVDASGVLEGETDSLADIMADVTTLLADLLDADLLALDPINIKQEVRAAGGQLDGSFARHTCQVTSLRTLGGDPIDITDCDGEDDPVTAAVTVITSVLSQVLDTVGGVDAGDGVALELFGTVNDTVTEDEDGWVRATSVMKVLELTVPDITVTPCDVEVIGQSVCALGIDLDEVLGDLRTGVDEVLATAHTTVTDALAEVDNILIALGSPLPVDAAAEAQTVVDNAVDALEGVLDVLALGSLGTGGGATVPGARIVVDPTLEAEHQVTTASVDDPTGAEPAPDPDDDPTLPNTGGGAALLAILALGAGAWLWRRRDLE